MTPDQMTQTSSNIDWHKPVTLADIVRAIEEVKEIPQPFNGATLLKLSADVAEKLSDVLEPYLAHPLTRATLSVEVSKALPEGYGIGFRPWRDGDDRDLEFLGPVMVWFLGPKSD